MTPRKGQPDVSGEVTEFEVDGSAPELAAALDEHGKRYLKTGQVIAIRAEQETPVTTVLANGTKETENVAAPGDYIVTGPGGERWVVKPETFETRYAPKPGEKTVYLARGEVIAVENPFGRPISLMAPWGERQHGAADCMIADVVNPATQRRAGEPYIISRAEFDRTYELVPAVAKKVRPAAKGNARREKS